MLFSGALAALHAARPNMRIWVAVREDLSQAVRCMSPWLDGVVLVPFDSYRYTVVGEPLLCAAAGLLDALPEGPFDAVIAAELRPTWVSRLVAGHIRPQSFLTLHRAPVSRVIHRLLRDHFRLAYPRATRYASASEPMHEIERYGMLLAAFGVDGDAAPQWDVPEAEQLRCVAPLGLEPARYVTAFPGGAASVAYKRWPVERFAAVLKCASDEFGLQPLIVGARSDADTVEELARACAACGVQSRVWYDPQVDFSVTRAVIAGAGAFVGNDSGPVHVSQACGVPGVTIFGGGHYPAYLSWGRAAVAVANPLPCFGCDWDCVFDRGLCTEAVSAADATDALRQALALRTGAAAVAIVSNVPATVREVVAAAATTYRKAQKDRAARFEAIQSLRLRDVATRADHEARSSLLQSENEGLREQLALASDAIRTGADELKMLHVVVDERLAKLNAASVEGEMLRAHAHERLQLINAATAEIETLREELARARAAAQPPSRSELERVADERLVALQNLDNELTSVRSEAVRRAEILAEMTDMLDRQGREIERLRSRGG